MLLSRIYSSSHSGTRSIVATILITTEEGSSLDNTLRHLGFHRIKTWLWPCRIATNGDRIFLLKPEHLKFIKSEQGNTLAWDGERYSHINDSLDQLEQSLAAQQFVRVHRGYLVNLDHVSEIQRWFNGKLMLIIDDDKKTEISTSRAGAEKLKSLIGF